MDLRAAISAPVILKSLERALIPTGWVIALPEGYEAQIRARSGLAIKYGISLVNAIGTIDWDYRDEVKVALVNLSPDDYRIMPHDRIAQFVVAPVTRAEWLPVSTVDSSESGSLARQGGFGSTGR